MIEPIDALLTGWVAPGAWATTWLPDDLDARVRSFDWTPIIVAGSSETKEDFLASFRVAAEFPDWVGNNWDAFEDAATDLSWLPATPLLLAIPASVPPLGIDILVGACAFWERHQRSASLVVCGDPLEGRAADLPRLDELGLFR